MAKFINDSSECTVWQYMECAYHDRFRCLIIEGDVTDEELKAAFQIIYSQYIDYSGLFLSAEFDKYAYIDSLEKRITTVTNFIVLQKEFIRQFDIPYIPAFSIVKKYGHRLFYNPESPDIELFLAKLDSMASKESKYTDIVATKKDELFKIQQKRNKQDKNEPIDKLQSRKQFISMLNQLQKNGNHIDKKNTMIEDVAIMIKDARDEKAEITANKQFNRGAKYY